MKKHYKAPYVRINSLISNEVLLFGSNFGEDDCSWNTTKWGYFKGGGTD